MLGESLYLFPLFLEGRVQLVLGEPQLGQLLVLRVTLKNLRRLHQGTLLKESVMVCVCVWGGGGGGRGEKRGVCEEG